MPTREEIAKVILSKCRPAILHMWEQGRRLGPLGIEFRDEALAAADAILALPSPAPVGDVALLARAEAAEAALASYKYVHEQMDETRKAWREWRTGRAHRPPAQQTAAAEAREEEP